MNGDPRYPIGRFVKPGKVSTAERRGYIERIAALPARLREMIAACSDARLDRPYRAGGWTARQVVHHLADSHMNAFIRVKLAVTENRPTIKPYDEAAWAELPDSRGLPVAGSLQLLDALHARWAVLLRALPEAAFARPLVHPDNGEMTVDTVVALYAWHGDHHLAHIAATRMPADA